MREELIISGRHIKNLDPHLHMWHWQIPLYLFLGGLAAGILFFAAFMVIKNNGDKYPISTKITPMIAPFALIIGLGALMLDLKHPLFSWQLYTTFRIESPMSWGAWTLMLVTPLSIVWVASYLKEIFPKIWTKNNLINKVMKLLFKEANNDKVNWEWKYDFLYKFEQLVIKFRTPMAWLMLVSSIILGVYTGILLSAFNARPLWNTAILGPLFLTSGLSTAAAVNIIFAKTKEERMLFSRIDIVLIIIELFLIVHMFMGFLAGSEIKIIAAQMFLGGEFTIPFWVLVVGLGLVIPLILESLELKGFHSIPAIVPAALVLIGGILFRFIMVDAGQIIRYLY